MGYGQTAGHQVRDWEEKLCLLLNKHASKDKEIKTKWPLTIKKSLLRWIKVYVKYTIKLYQKNNTGFNLIEFLVHCSAICSC